MARWFALVAAVAPVLAINLGWLIATHQQHIPPCIPYVDGCAATSAVGRAPPEAWVFKPLMLAGALAMVGFWVCAAGPRLSRWIAIVGIGGALALTAYTLALGADGDAMRLTRRLGAAIFFVATFIAQTALAIRFWHEAGAGWLRLALAALCTLQLLIGVGSLLLADMVQDRSAFQNRVEWNYELLLCGFYALAAYAAGTPSRRE